MNKNTDRSTFSLLPEDDGFDPIEDRLRSNVRATIEAMFEEALADFLARLRYGRGACSAKGCRHEHREQQGLGDNPPYRHYCSPAGNS